MISLEELAKCKTFAQIAELLPNKPKATVWNWHKNGVAAKGKRVKLQAVRVGGTYLVTPECLEKFLRDCNPEAPTLPENPTKETKRLQAGKERVARMLKGEG